MGFPGKANAPPGLIEGAAAAVGIVLPTEPTVPLASGCFETKLAGNLKAFGASGGLFSAAGFGTVVGSVVPVAAVVPVAPVVPVVPAGGPPRGVEGAPRRSKTDGFFGGAASPKEGTTGAGAATGFGEVGRGLKI